MNHGLGGATPTRMRGERTRDGVAPASGGRALRESIHTKEMLLRVGEAYEAQIAADRATEAAYR